MSFNDCCNQFGTDKGDNKPSGNNYAKFYDFWFSQIKNTTKNICEIGVNNGGSLKCLYEYFPNAELIGLDIDNKSQFNNERTKTLILDQGNSKDLDGFIQYCELSNIKFDIIIDDGSHDVKHQQLTFGKLFQLVKEGGIYIIEDLGSSYFTLGTKLYGYVHTQTKINNNTIKFLNQRPFSSIWISQTDLEYINQSVDFVCTFDTCNKMLPYSSNFICENNFPIRSITSVIKKK